MLQCSILTGNTLMLPISNEGHLSVVQYSEGDTLVFCAKNADLNALFKRDTLMLHFFQIGFLNARAGHSLRFPLFAIPLLQRLFSLSLLRYFSENCNTLLAICYRYFFSLVLQTASILELYLRKKDPQN
jgi:hypothetical protein